MEGLPDASTSVSIKKNPHATLMRLSREAHIARAIVCNVTGASSWQTVERETTSGRRRMSGSGRCN